MNKNILLLFLILTSLSYGQKVEIDSTDTLIFNDKKVSLDLTRDELKEVFGNPDRITLKHNIIWTYDELGFMIYIKPQTLKIMNITINFKKETHDFFPKEKFKGTLIIFGSAVTEYTTSAGLKSIEKEAIKRNRPPVYSIKTSNHSMHFFQSEKMKSELSGCEINLI